MSARAGWDEGAQRPWASHDRTGALDTVARLLNASGADEPEGLPERFSYHCSQVGDAKGAPKAIERLLERFPVWAERLKNRVVLLGRLGRHAEAAADLEAALKITPHFPEIYYRLFAVRYRLGQTETAREAGTKALSLKLAQAGKANEPLRLPAVTATAKSKDVRAFSLWGATPRYLRGLLRTALTSPDLYPGRCLCVYHDDSVPPPFLELLTKLGVGCHVMVSDAEIGQKLIWRFL